MKLLLLLLFNLTLFVNYCFAQGGYKPGYIVTSKGDTLKGFVNYKAKGVLFKPDVNAKAQTFIGSEAAFVHIDHGKEYLTYTGPISLGTIDIDHMMVYRDTNFKFATVFLDVIQRGRWITLYAYTDDLKTRFFYAEKGDDKPKEFLYRLYYDNAHPDITAGKGRTVNENIFMEQLFDLAAKYHVLTTAMQHTIEQALYKKYYMNDIIERINLGTP